MTENICSDTAKRVASVRQRIVDASAKAGRHPDKITLVGVTKTQTAQAVKKLLECGVTTIGENRVQEILEKAPELANIPHKTHLIGHLQSNKAKYLPGNIDMIQSIDSVKTIEAIEKAFAEANKPLDVLIEVNIGDESSKTGVSPQELFALAERVVSSKILRLRGLMAIPPFLEGEAVRPYFAQMYELFIDIKAKKMDNNTVNILSMGMSADFEYAIMEGSTMVRVGTDLFGPRQK